MTARMFAFFGRIGRAASVMAGAIPASMKVDAIASAAAALAFNRVMQAHGHTLKQTGEILYRATQSQFAATPLMGASGRTALSDSEQRRVQLQAERSQERLVLRAIDAGERPLDALDDERLPFPGDAADVELLVGDEPVDERRVAERADDDDLARRGKRVHREPRLRSGHAMDIGLEILCRPDYAAKIRRARDERRRVPRLREGESPRAPSRSDVTRLRRGDTRRERERGE